MAEPLRRAAFDLMAYGQHFPTCTKGRVLVAQDGWRAAIREKRCSCGLDAALDGAFAALAPVPVGQKEGERK